MCGAFCSLALMSSVDVDKMEEEMERANGGYRNRDGRNFSRETDYLNGNSTDRSSYGTGNSASSNTYFPPPPVHSNIKPEDMTLKQLRQAISDAGLSAEAVGLSEKQEFIALLENYRARTTMTEARAGRQDETSVDAYTYTASNPGDID